MRKPALERHLPALVALVAAAAAGACGRKPSNAGTTASPVAPALRARLTVAPGDPLISAPIVQISATEIRLGKRTIVSVAKGRIPPTSKRDGGDGYFIAPLHEAARTVLERHGSTGAPSKRRCVVLAVARDLPYRLVAEVLYTLAQAGYDCFQVAARATAEPAATLVGLPITMPRLAATARSAPEPGRWQDDGWGNRYFSPGLRLAGRTPPPGDPLRDGISTGGLGAVLAATRKPPGASAAPGLSVSLDNTPAALRAALRRAMFGLQGCYDRERKPMQPLVTKATFWLSVRKDGTVHGVRAESTEGPALVRCLRDRIAKWRLGPVAEELSLGPIMVTFRPVE